MWTALIVLCALPTVAQAAASHQMIDSFQYASDAQARAAWKPMAPGMPVEAPTTPVAGRKGLKLPCDLTGDVARSAWDRSVDWDLSRTDRLAFWFYVDDPDKVSPAFSIYLESGEGSYGATFSAGKGWSHVAIYKARFGTEGKPEGRRNVKTIRLSIWKSVSAVTFAAIDNMEAISSDVVVILGDRTSTCPMDYTGSPVRLDPWVRAQPAATGHVRPILPGIGVTLGDWTLTPDQVVRQINVARKRGADGFTLFHLDRYVVDELLKALRSGATAR